MVLRGVLWASVLGALLWTSAGGGGRLEPLPGAEKRGCCSHHGGVCGCNGGHTMCCDGKPSPSCGC
jgi:hypothetical protein